MFLELAASQEEQLSRQQRQLDRLEIHLKSVFNQINRTMEEHGLDQQTVSNYFSTAELFTQEAWERLSLAEKLYEEEREKLLTSSAPLSADKRQKLAELQQLSLDLQKSQSL